MSKPYNWHEPSLPKSIPESTCVICDGPLGEDDTSTCDACWSGWEYTYSLGPCGSLGGAGLRRGKAMESEGEDAVERVGWIENAVRAMEDGP